MMQKPVHGAPACLSRDAALNTTLAATRGALRRSGATASFARAFSCQPARISPPWPPRSSPRASRKRANSWRLCSPASSATCRPRSPCSTCPPRMTPWRARLAINDNNTTGRFLKQEFSLDVVQSASVPSSSRRSQSARAPRRRSFVDRRRQPHHRAGAGRRAQGSRRADHERGFSADDRLREADCRRNVVHTAPSRACWPTGWRSISCGSSWRRWFLVRGRTPTMRPLPRPFGAPPSASAPRSWRSARSTLIPATDARTAATSRSRNKSPPSLRTCPTMTCWWSPTRAANSATTCPIARWDARPVAGTQGLVADELASGAGAMGRHPISEPVSCALPIGPCAPSTTMYGWRFARSARRQRARGA